MTEMNASVVLMYRESFGCGMDTESNTPDGVTVSLTFWEGTGDVDFLYAKPRYVVMSRVVVDRKIVIDSTAPDPISIQRRESFTSRNRDI